MICPKCGFEAAEGSIICAECLSPLSGAAAAAAAPAAQTAEPCAPAAKSTEAVKVKKRRPVLRILLIVLGVILAAAAACYVLFCFTGCAQPVEDTAANNEIDNELFALPEDILPDSGEEIVVNQDDIVFYDPVAFPYANSPIIGTWVMLEDYADGYDNWDYISELTSDGYVYEWYGDGLGYYEPLCSYEYFEDEGKIIYHYADHDSVYACEINGSRMITTDAYGNKCEYVRLSSDINLSVADIEDLYVS